MTILGTLVRHQQHKTKMMMRAGIMTLTSLFLLSLLYKLRKRRKNWSQQVSKMIGAASIMVKKMKKQSK